MITAQQIFEFFAAHFGYELDDFKKRSQRSLITLHRRTAFLISNEMLGKAVTIASLAKSFNMTEGSVYESIVVGKELLSVNDCLLTDMYTDAKRAFTLHLIDRLQNTL